MKVSLRARLVVGLVALVLGGLLVADVVTYVRLGDLLQARVDDQLMAAKPQALAALGLGPDFGPPHGPPHGQFRGGPPGFATYEALVAGDGTVLYQPPDGSDSTNQPVLPTPLSGVALDTPITVSGTGGSQWRLLVESVGENQFAVVAVPLSEVSFALDQIVLLDAEIGAAALVALVVLSLLIVRIGLRPL